MPAVSVIIVSYNVKNFLKQCLQSVYNSDIANHLEVIVVDNNSTDGSVNMIRSAFPGVQILDNNENLGFSKANNQGLEVASGDYVLFLNPDTLVEEDSISVCLEYLKRHPETGAAGARMMDGAGNFLPESKRGFPTPLSAVFKMSGLSSLFSTSAIFNHYYLGHLDPSQTQEIDVLTGAFFMAPAKLIKEIGGFDEDYFMYGEDVELSYQIRQRGYKIVYIPESRIVHFKGESTNKSSFAYIRNFYGAMQTYARKREGSNSFLWKILIPVGIIMTAGSRLLKDIFSKALRPFIDMGVLILAAHLYGQFWAAFYYRNPYYYDYAQTFITTLMLCGVMVFCFYLFGQYDRKHNIKHLLYGALVANLSMFTIYSLLPESMRFSRIVLLLLGLTAPLLLYITRRIYNILLYRTDSFEGFRNKRVAVAGSEDSFRAVKLIFDQYENDVKVIHLPVQKNNVPEAAYFKNFTDARNINVLVFCSKDLTAQEIFAAMSRIGDRISFRIANNDNSGILGSDSKDRLGEWYTQEFAFKIDQKFHRRLKRLFDLVVSPVLILLAPVSVAIGGRGMYGIRNIPPVIAGRKTWIGYIDDDPERFNLPPLRKGVFNIRELHSGASPEDRHRWNTWYGRQYNIWLDLSRLFDAFFSKG